MVFAQRSDWRIDVDAWNAHATRFFATRLGLESEMGNPPDDRASPGGTAVFLVSPVGEAAGRRWTFARPCTEEDYARADAAEARAGHTGLARLARRCPTIWLVVREAAPDQLSLRLAAILASILLGPILDGGSAELFGVKTARAKLLK